MHWMHTQNGSGPSPRLTRLSRTFCGRWNSIRCLSPATGTSVTIMVLAAVVKRRSKLQIKYRQDSMTRTPSWPLPDFMKQPENTTSQLPGPCVLMTLTRSTRMRPGCWQNYMLESAILNRRASTNRSATLCSSTGSAATRR